MAAAMSSYFWGKKGGKNFPSKALEPPRVETFYIEQCIKNIWEGKSCAGRWEDWMIYNGLFHF